MAGPLSFDDIPDQAPPQQGALSFDDLPDQMPVAQEAPAAPSFDEMEHQEPVDAPDLPPQPAVASPPLKGKFTPKAQAYLANRPTPTFDPNSIAAPEQTRQLAKSGTTGLAIDNSDKARERQSLADSAVGYHTNVIRNYFLDPNFRQLSNKEQDSIIDAYLDQAATQGLPAGKLNPAQPDAFTNPQSTFKQSLKTFANEFRKKGALAQAPGAYLLPGETDRMVVAQAPELFGSEELGAMGVSAAQATPGIFGGNLAAEAGAAAGQATGLPGGGLVGGLAGALAGAAGADAAIREYAESDSGEWLREGIRNLDDAAEMAQQEHPIWSATGRFGAQMAHNPLGIARAVRSRSLGEFAPSLGGGALGAAVETGSELGRGEELDPYKIGEAGFTGMFARDPDYLRRGPALNYQGRPWVDTNKPRPDLMKLVADAAKEGKSPAAIRDMLAGKMADTPANRLNLLKAVADIRRGADPTDSLNAIRFRPDGIAVKDVEDAIAPHREGFDPDLKITVHDSYDSETIPPERRQDVGPGTLGWKDEDGNIHLVASQMADAETAVATLFHEGMHVGVARLYQQELNDKLIGLYDRANPNFRAALEKEANLQAETNPDWDKLSDDEKKALLADEVLAGAAENGVYKNEFDDVVSWLRDFGRKHLGKFGEKLKYSDGEVRKIMSMGYAKLGENATATGPVRFMNVGVQSRTADHDSLDSYEGQLPMTPEYPGGWFKGVADDGPRYEISDAGSEIIDLTQIGRDEDVNSPHYGQPVKLNEVLRHPLLYDAYPELADVDVKLEQDSNSAGSFDPTTGQIFLSPKSRDPRGTLLHEIQHYVQDKEGWAKGSNVPAAHLTSTIDALRLAAADKADHAAGVLEQKRSELHNLLAAQEQFGPEIAKLNQLKQEIAVPEGELDLAKLVERDEGKTALKNKLVEQGLSNFEARLITARLVDSEFDFATHKRWAEESVETWTNIRDRYERIVNGTEEEARHEARYQDELKKLLYYRAGGEYEARQTASRKDLTDKERFEKSQVGRPDEAGVNPLDTYKPQGLVRPQELAPRLEGDINVTPMPDDTWDGEAHRVTVRDPQTGDVLYEGNVDVDKYGNLGPVTLFDAQTGEPINTRSEDDQYIRELTRKARDRVEWNKPMPAGTRFSRKYSGSFSNDFEGRRARTKDFIHNRHGNFSVNNIREMMRPLPEYEGKTRTELFAAAQRLKEQGFNPELAIAQGAIPDDSAFVIALDALVDEKLRAGEEVAKRYRSSGGMRHERELVRAAAELGQIVAVMDKTASNLGRMLYALQLRIRGAQTDEALKAVLNNVRFANGKLDEAALDDIAKAFITRNPTNIRKAIDKFDPDWKHYAQSLFYNSLLGTKSVQFGNILGNSSNIIRQGVSDVLGYAAGKTVSLFKKTDRMHSDELFARQRALLAGLLNQKTYDGTRALNTAIKEFSLKAGSQVHENKFVSQSIDNLPLSMVLEWGTRGVQATDAYFRTALEHAAMEGLAHREARRLNGGRRPGRQQVADLMANPTKKMLSDVAAEADRLLFQEDPFKGAEKFSQLIRAIPGGWLLAPFVRTPANIGRTALETFDFTGRMTKRNRDALKAGGPEAYRVRGQQLLASALWAGTIYLLQNGMLHGGGPSEPSERAQWLMNNQPYSIGSKETGFIPMKAVSPLGDGLAVIADTVEGYGHATKKPDMANADVALAAAGAMSNAFLTNSFASSVTDALDRGVQPTMANLAGSLVKSAAMVPFYSEYKKNKDPFVRDTAGGEGLMKTLAGKASLMSNPAAEHYFKSVVPREELPIKRDPFGSAIMAKSPTSDDPVANEIGRLVDSTKQSIVPGFERTQKGRPIPNDVYNAFLATAGPLMREAVSQIMKDPTYRKTLDDQQRAALIRSNKNLKGLHARLNKLLQQMMLERDPSFEANFIDKDTRTLTTIPGVMDGTP